MSISFLVQMRMLCEAYPMTALTESMRALRIFFRISSKHACLLMCIAQSLQGAARRAA